MLLTLIKRVNLVNTSEFFNPKHIINAVIAFLNVAFKKKEL